MKIDELDKNIASVEQHLSRLLTQPTGLVVFPECMLTGYAFADRREAMAAAIQPDHECFAAIADMISRSAAAGAVVSLGTLLRENDRLFNAAVLVNHTGVVATYRKVHLPALGVDQFVDRVEASDPKPYPAHVVGDLRIGMAICYDCSFPEPMRMLGLAGVDVVALGTNWPVAAERTAEVVPPARSMENHYYFIAANRVGTERGFTFCGRSSICGPDGVVLAMAQDDRPQVLTANIDVEQARHKRIERTAGAHVIDRMADRRPELYDEIIRPIKDSSRQDHDTLLD